jgi:hypothetical protein
MPGKLIKRVARKMFGWGLHPDWGVLAASPAWSEARSAAAGGPNVLIATSVGGFAVATQLESTLAVALTLRGARVHVLLCDRFLPACVQAIVRQFPLQREFVRHGPSRVLCRTCFTPARKMYESLGLNLHRFSDLITESERRSAEQLDEALSVDQIRNYTLDDLAVGEHALAGALRFFARGDLDGESNADAVLRRYFRASLLTTYATRNLLEKVPMTAVCVSHGIYVPYGLIAEVARSKNIRLANWNVAYRKQSFIFSHQHTYHHELLSESPQAWEDMDWSPELEETIVKYIRSRASGTEDWIYFHDSPREDLAELSTTLGVDFSKPVIGLLSNVIWDAQLHYPANAFPNMLDWVIRTIRYFEARPELQLVIRIHPAEIRGNIPSRQLLETEIRQAFKVLPPNVFVIGPEHRISTYKVMLGCNAVVIYGTKMGVELSALGIPVIVAGEAWIRNKGVSMDAKSDTEYFSLLDRLPLPSRLDDVIVERARKYAFHFFFRRMIPLPFMEPRPGEWPPFQSTIRSLSDLEPGRHRGLDVICDGILTGSEFIYPLEKLQ